MVPNQPPNSLTPRRFAALSWRWILLLAAMFLCRAAPTLFGQDDPSLAQLAAPLDDTSRADIISSLKTINPAGMTGARAVTTPGGVYILYGDLFNNHQLCAVAEVNGVSFALWNGRRWEPRGSWKISPVWRPKGWKPDDNDDEHFPVPPAEEPFRMLPVAPGKPPLVVMVGDVWKYWQENYLAKYNPATRNLELIDESAGYKVVDGYVRSYSGTGHRATFVDWYFHRWTGDKLVPVAYWYEGDPDAANDNGETEVVKAGVYTGGKKTASYRFAQSDDTDATNWAGTLDGRSFGKIVFHWKKPGDAAGLEMLPYAYLFEKLTGLPRAIYPGIKGGADPAGFESRVKITVTGTPAAIKKLSPGGFKLWPF